ncbi:MAG: mobile mystery protein A [Bacteroidales bacterium]|nr:mobile mystery protein A [Bacteroidales bacterium]
MNKKKLIQEQLDKKIVKFSNLEGIVVPPNGWIYSIRQGINMSLRQLGQRLSITPQSVKEIEEREKNNSISLNVLKQVASALDMHFVYGFIPKEKTLEKMVKKRAADLAKQIVERTSVHMNLEDQKITQERIKKAINEKTEELTRELPKILWD